MRLLHTLRLDLSDFSGATIPPYAILSHRWENEEVTYHDLVEGKAAGMAGFKKIQGCCAQAAQDGWEYAWVDSCCINKTSSAELSEAINSMFAWYSRASICYAYLSDVKSEATLAKIEFRKSQWFTRGWTLQELLAPRRVEFFNRDWVEIGTKSSLQEEITGITGIKDIFGYKDACVAQKMSWATNRKTTRIEDQAYCLMGLFGVHMTPIYGEEEQAFIRLQMNILDQTHDETLFAWDLPWGTWAQNLSPGLLAHSPEYFRHCGNYKRGTLYENRAPLHMTSKGLAMEVQIFSKAAFPDFLTPQESEDTGSSDVMPAQHYLKSAGEALAPIDCMLGDTGLYLSLPLSRSPSGWTRCAGYMLRISISSLKNATVRGMAETKMLYVKQNPRDLTTFTPKLWRPSKIVLRIGSLTGVISVTKKYFHRKYDPSCWQVQDNGDILLDGEWFNDDSASLRLEGKGLEPLAVVVGRSLHDMFWVGATPITKFENLRNKAEEMALKWKDKIGPDRVCWDFSNQQSLLVSLRKVSHAEINTYVIDVSLIPASKSVRID